MEVGSLRERILIALLVHEFGIENIDTEIPITTPEIDVIAFDNPLSIKTITGKRLVGVKLIWTVDRDNVLEFAENYTPTCDILIAHINWGGMGGLYLIPLQIQVDLMDRIGRNQYLKLPKPGTNPRGVELSTASVRTLVHNEQSLGIPIRWGRREINYNPYDRWLDYWEEDD